MRSSKIKAIQKDNPLYFDITYRIARTNVLRRDKYKCRICRKRYGLTVHHLVDKSKNRQFIANEDNMVTLCKSCHSKIHKNKSWRLKNGC